MDPISSFTDPRSRNGAEFNECRSHRYALWRRWCFDGPLRFGAFICLNPSTADEDQDDPTVRRCINYCKAWGLGGFVMLNAYGYRSTDPAGLKDPQDPIGSGNNYAIQRYSRAASIVICAWGVHCELKREREICELVDRPLFCLGVTKQGRPRHPLYLRRDVMPKPFFLPITEVDHHE